MYNKISEYIYIFLYVKKTLTRALLLLVFKIVKSPQCIPKEYIVKL